ncbi:MAG: VWA domain-containing protein [Gemmataceae bacterium]|nr:VWA domain-containing protein [Gemmataceae bacterium]MCI0740142.1 VWA domain-containing protein [Gemmataceae bacterium]
MRKFFAVLFAVVLAAAVPALGQDKAAAPYKIDFEPARDVTLSDKDDAGKQGLFVTVRFVITLDGAPETAGVEYKIIIEEDGQRVKEEDVPRPTPSEDLSVVLAMDTSGSMKEHGRMKQAKSAAETFLDRLPSKAECGLILFDHEIRPPTLTPVLDRGPLVAQIRKVEPRGGTAYLDAAAKGVDLLRNTVTGRERALVLMTDGVDINSATTLEQVIQKARQARIRVYTIGIGEPGKLEQVNTTLVLDHSGSMQPPAADEDVTPKIKALHTAAARFISIVPSYGRVSLIPFSTAVGTPKEFTNNKATLTEAVLKLSPQGETAIFDATYAAVATLEADAAKGKRAVIAMTDGIDNSSRRRVEEVIERAKEAKVPLYMLGFGRPGELDETTMKRMAAETGGRYYHAKNEKALLDIFENLSIQLHDDGIDEKSLTQLAHQTGGRYYPAKNVSDLSLIVESVSKSILQKSYEVTFPSLRQVRDGTARNITLKLVRRSGELASNQVGGSVLFGANTGIHGEEVLATKKAGYQTHGVVVAEMSPIVYLFFLIVIGMLIALPSMMKKSSAS